MSYFFHTFAFFIVLGAVWLRGGYDCRPTIWARFQPSGRDPISDDISFIQSRRRLMKNFFKMLAMALMALLALGLSGAAMADEHRGTADEAMAMVKKAGAYLKEHGKEKAIAAFNKSPGEFIRGDLYVFMFGMSGDKSGVALAHGQNPKMVDKNLTELNAGGVYPIKEFLKLAGSPAGKGWVDYKWPNSISKNLEDKHTYIERFGDVLIGVGVYR
jgi:cytochrome c